MSMCGDVRNTHAGSGASLTSIKNLQGKDGYASWKFKMKMYLLHEDLWSAVVGYSEDDTTSETLRKNRDLKALTKMCLTLDGSAITHVRACITAKEVWDTLANAYEDKGMGRKLSLERKLYRYQLADFSTIEEYINAVISTAQDLADIGKKIDDSSIGAILLGGLTTEFDPLVMALENCNIEVTSELVKQKLLNESAKRESKELVLATKERMKPNKVVPRNIICYQCKQPGHKRPDCPQRKKGTQERQKKSKSVSNETTLISALGVGGNLSPTDWYVDSGASTHMTCSKEWLTNFNYSSEVKNITLANNRKVNSAGYGEVLLEQDNKLKLSSIKEVMYVPDLCTNLISVNKAVKKGLTIVFDKKGCSLYKHNDVRVVGTTVGHATCSVGGLYRLDHTPIYPVSAMVMEANVTSNLWHRRLGHLCRVALEQLRHGKAKGIEYSSLDKTPCVACIEGKQIRKPFKTIEYKKGTRMLEVVHSDVCGPFDVLSLESNRYLVIFVDDFSRMIFSYFIRSKADVKKKFLEFEALVERETSHKIRNLRTDNGGEYVNAEFEAYLASKGIKHQTTVPYCPESNGVAERTNRSLVEKARCMLQDSGLPKTFWEEAVRTATYLKNRCPHRALKNRTPYELWYNRLPDIAHLRIFGCRAYVHVPSCNRQKLDAKAKEYIFVGYCDDNKSYRFRDPTNIRKCVKGRDVVFLEDCFSNTKVDDDSHRQDIILSSNTNNLQVQGSSIVESALNDDPEASTSTSAAVPPLPMIYPVPATSIVPAEEDVMPVETDRRYNLRDRKTVNYHCSVCCCSAMQSGELNDEPYSFSDAVSRPDKDMWIAAMEDEYKSLMSNGAWTLVENKGQKIVPCKWVYKLKRDSEGVISRYKARLVAKGFHQSYGIDYEETFSPVVRYSSLRVLIALATEKNWKMHHLDIDTAFLHGKLEEKVYMTQPQGFVAEGEETKVCQLNKSLYGLKQAARAWNKRLDEVLRELGYNKLESEPCIYIKRSATSIAILAIYVDDLVLIYDKQIELSYLKNGLKEFFGVKDLGELSYCLGLHVVREKETNDVKVNQKRYILETLNRFNMTECKTVSTPMDTSIDLRSQTEPAVNVPYQNLIGCLMFLAINTRPDILFAVSFLSQFNKNPMKAHWTAAKRILQYLKGTLDYGLKFKKTKKPLCGFVDADWANGGDRRSYTGYLYKLADAPVSWECKKQPTVALSSTEAEYMALSSASKEAVYLQRLVCELTGEFVKITLYNDNQSAKKLAENPVHHNRTKHIDVRFHFIRELVESEKITIVYLPTDKMLADVLTKGLNRCKHQRCVSGIGLIH